MSETLAGGRYDVLRRLAVGGMGEVLLAEFAGDDDLSPGLLVVKRALTGPGGDRAGESQLQMLREEGRLGLRLRHENIVETLRIEEDGGNPLLVMELLSGRSMAQVLAQAKKRRENVPIDIALAVLRGAACGLHFAHTLTGPDGAALGLVHRDISPANIFVTFDRRVKVIDFGVAKSADSEIKTATGILKGKLGYMSPEQSLGEGALTPQADVWSLGVFFWEMLLAERLFHSPNPTATLMQISSRELTRPSATRADVPRGVDDICMSMLSRPLDRRFKSCAAIVAAIDALPGGGGAARADVGAWLSGRFPEEADAGARDAARSARRLRALPVPQGLSDGSLAADDSPEAGIVTAETRGPVLGTEADGAVDEPDEPDLATVRLDAGTVEKLRRASRIGPDDDQLPTERIGPETLALARQQALAEATARNVPAAATEPSGPPSIDPPPRAPPANASTVPTRRPHVAFAQVPLTTPPSQRAPLPPPTSVPPSPLAPTRSTAGGIAVPTTGAGVVSASAGGASQNLVTGATRMPAAPRPGSTSSFSPPPTTGASSSSSSAPPRVPTNAPAALSTSPSAPPSAQPFAPSSTPPSASMTAPMTAPPSTSASSSPPAAAPSSSPPSSSPSSARPSTSPSQSTAAKGTPEQAPAETPWLSVAVATFGGLVVLIGIGFSLLMPPLQPHFFAYTDVGGFDVIVGDREQAPAGAVVREIIPSTNPLLRRAGTLDVGLTSGDELEQGLKQSGVWARASVPATPRGRAAALMPVVIIGLGLLALAFAVPAFFVRGGGALHGVRAACMALVLVAIAALVQFGGLGWPGRAVTTSTPRLEWR